MGDLLLALLAFTVLAALALTVLAGLTIVPFVVALQLAAARGLSPGRVGMAAAAGVLLGLAVAASPLLLGATPALVLAAVVVVWAVPAALRVLGAPALAGRAGRHE